MNALYALYGARAHRAKVLLNPNNSTNVGEVAFRARRMPLIFPLRSILWRPDTGKAMGRMFAPIPGRSASIWPRDSARGVDRTHAEPM